MRHHFLTVRRFGRNRRAPRRSRLTVRPIPGTSTLIVTVTIEGSSGWSRQLQAHAPSELYAMIESDLHRLAESVWGAAS
jgi:hypothetical protein